MLCASLLFCVYRCSYVCYSISCDSICCLFVVLLMFRVVRCCLVLFSVVVSCLLSDYHSLSVFHHVFRCSLSLRAVPAGPLRYDISARLYAPVARAGSQPARRPPSATPRATASVRPSGLPTPSAKYTCRCGCSSNYFVGPRAAAGAILPPYTSATARAKTCPPRPSCYGNATARLARRTNQSRSIPMTAAAAHPRRFFKRRWVLMSRLAQAQSNAFQAAAERIMCVLVLSAFISFLFSL